MRTLTIDPVTLLERGDAMFATQPFGEVVLEDPADGIEWDHLEVAAALGQRDWISRIESVVVAPYRTLADGEALGLLLGNATSLTELRVPHPSSVEGIATLALPSLVSLYVYCEGSSDGDAALASLARRPRQLRELQIVGCAITEAAARTIASARWPLTYLAFGSTHYVTDELGARGLIALANAASLSTLTTLDLVATSIDDAAVEILAASPYLHALEQLGIAENTRITDAGLVALASSPTTSKLRQLALYETSATEEGIAAFRAQRPDIDVGGHVFTRWGGG